MRKARAQLRVVPVVIPFVLIAACATAAPPEPAPAPKAASETETPLTKNADVTRDDKVVTQDVRKAIKSEAMLTGRDIAVETVKGEVHLTGVVKTTDERQRAEGLARTVPGVKEVNNRIELEK
jgi:osmotically-inducible protein OsmY